MSRLFSADSDKVSFGDVTTFDGLTALSAWIDVTIASLPGTGTLLRKWGNGSGCIFLFVTSDGALNFYIQAPGALYQGAVSNTGAVTAGRHRIGVKWTSTTGTGQDVIRFNVDGVDIPRASYALDNNQGNAGILNDAELWGYGEHGQTGIGAARMQLWRSALWSAARTDADWTALNGGQPPTAFSGLVWDNLHNLATETDSVTAATGTATGTTFTDPKFRFVFSAKVAGTDGGTTAAKDSTNSKLIVVKVTSFKGATAPILGDSEGNTWLPGTVREGASNTRVRILYCIDPVTDAAHTFTLTQTGSFAELEVVGFANSNAVSYEAEAGATGFAPGSLTPGSAGALVIAVLTADADAATYTINGTYTIIESTAYSAGVNEGGAMAYLAQEAAAAANPTWACAGTPANPVSAAMVFVSTVAAPSISYPTSPASLQRNVAISTISVVSAGGPITSYAVQSGSLPTGLSLNTGTGAITGTPTTNGSYSAVIRATGAGGTGDWTFERTIADPGTGAFASCTILAGAGVNQAKLVFSAPSVSWIGSRTIVEALSPTFACDSVGYTAGVSGTRARSITSKFSSSAIVGETLEVTVDLKEPIFASCTSVTVTIAAGYATDGATNVSGAATAQACTNSAAGATPNTVARWGTEGPYMVISADTDVEVRPSALLGLGEADLWGFDCVAYRISVNGGAYGAESLVQAISTSNASGRPGFCHRILLASYSDGDYLKIAARVCPKVGAAQLDLVGDTPNRRGVHAVYVRIDKTGAWRAPRTVYLKADSGSSDANTGATALVPLRTTRGCFARVAANLVSNDVSGMLVIVLADGDEQNTRGHNSVWDYTTATDPIEWRVAPGVTATDCTFGVDADVDRRGCRISKETWRGIDMVGLNAFISGNNATGVLVRVGCTFDGEAASTDNGATYGTWELLYARNSFEENVNRCFPNHNLLDGRVDAITGLPAICGQHIGGTTLENQGLFRGVWFDDMNSAYGVPVDPHCDTMKLQTQYTDGWNIIGDGAKWTNLNTAATEGFLVQGTGTQRDVHLSNIAWQGGVPIDFDVQGTLENFKITACSGVESQFRYNTDGGSNPLVVNNCRVAGSVFDAISYGNTLTFPHSTLHDNHTVDTPAGVIGGFDLTEGGSAATLVVDVTDQVPIGVLRARISPPFTPYDVNGATRASTTAIGAVAGATEGVATTTGARVYGLAFPGLDMPGFPRPGMVL